MGKWEGPLLESSGKQSPVAFASKEMKIQLHLQGD
jgi:hypothetical protein